MNNEFLYCHYSPDYGHFPSPCLFVKSPLLYKNAFCAAFLGQILLLLKKLGRAHRSSSLRPPMPSGHGGFGSRCNYSVCLRCAARSWWELVSHSSTVVVVFVHFGETSALHVRNVLLLIGATLIHIFDGVLFYIQIIFQQGRSRELCTHWSLLLDRYLGQKYGLTMLVWHGTDTIRSGIVALVLNQVDICHTNNVTNSNIITL